MSSRSNHRAFLSHSNLDKPFVRLLAADIAGFDIGIWLDELELNVADSLIKKLSAAISSSSFVLACLSPHSIRSEWVQRELAIGLSLRHEAVTVIPLILDGLKDEEIPPSLADRIYADFRGPEKYDAAFRRILRVLQPAEAAPSKPNVLSALESDPLPIDDHRIFRLLRIAAQEQMRQWVINYLKLALATHLDPTDRHWIYTGLGSLGGDEVGPVLLEGLKDSSPWARGGAKEAARKLGLI